MTRQGLPVIRRVSEKEARELRIPPHVLPLYGYFRWLPYARSGPCHARTPVVLSNNIRAISKAITRRPVLK